jgi:hypothetical protein
MDVHPLGNLRGSRLPAELLQQRRGALAYPVQGSGAVERDPHDPALLGQRLEDGLSNPPDGVGDELDALGLVELVGRADEAEVALVDQVGEGHALVLILLGHGNDESQVAADQLVESLRFPDANPLRQVDLFLLRDQRVLADLT